MSNIIKRKGKSLLQLMLVIVLSFRLTRSILNVWYNTLSYKSMNKFHRLFAKTFVNRTVPFKYAEWTIFFLNIPITIPLYKDSIWLDWDEAISILGHDIKIKQTYEYLITNNQVRCFFDVGANYGTHTLLFLSKGIDTYTFEPNPHCIKGMGKLLLANDINDTVGVVVESAVGDKNYKTELMFPERETWLGSLVSEVQTELSVKYKLMRTPTTVITLDSYSKENRVIPDLIKIDTEGFELQVLKGAEYLLRNYTPKVIFEENGSREDRGNIANFLDSIGYSIFTLPYTDTNKRCVNKAEFIYSTETNFIAVHY